MLAKGAKVEIKNRAGETAVTCCPIDGDIANALRLNAHIKRKSAFLGNTFKILTKYFSFV